MTVSILSDQFKRLNRDAILEVLAANTNLAKKDYEVYANQISDTLKRVSRELDTDN